MVAAGSVLYVDDTATGANDGSTWCDAYTDLQPALATATAGDEVRVAQGIYRPAGPGGDRTATFQLVNGVALRGGYAGCGAPDPDDRDIAAHETILSGDLSGDDTPVACTNNSPNCDSFGRLCVDNFCIIKQNNTENSYHVVTGSGTDTTAILDGFTITAGNADDIFLNNDGSGMFNETGSPTVTNCTFSGNSASSRGGGMYNFNNSNPTMTNCTFSGNSHTGVFGAGGGGMYNSRNSNPTVTNCTFSHNSAKFGGGMNNCESNPTLTNCTFSENSATETGGGMDNDGNPMLTDCTFYGNQANNIGGGMYNVGNATLTNCMFYANQANKNGGGIANGGSPMLTNCTFSGNSAGVAGGMYNVGNATLTNCTFSGNSAGSFLGLGGGGMFNDSGGQLMLINCTFSGNSAAINGGGMFAYLSSPALINCILWGNSDEGGMDESAQIHVDSSSPTVSYSIIQGLNTFAGNGNVGDDPLFVDASGQDDTAGTEDDDVRLLPGSPCIDAGNNDAVLPDSADLDDDGDTTEPTPLDLDGDARFVDDPATPDTGNPGTLGPPIVDMGAFEFVNLCGNGVMDPGEECDNGGDNSDTEPDACRTNCRQASCGDGVLDTGEECDDGNLDDGDLCSRQCLIEGAFIPTISEWGMVILMLTLLIAITLSLRR